MNLITSETAEVVQSREITPLIDRVRAKLPLKDIAAISLDVTFPGYRVDTDEDAKTANGYLRKCAEWEKTISNEWEPYKKFFNALHKSACSAEANTAPDVAEIKRICQEELAGYLKRKKAAEAQRQAALDAVAKADRERIARESRVAAITGDIETAAKLAESAQAVRAPVIMAPPTKLEGTATREKWNWQVTDPMELIKAIADGRVPLMHEVVVKGKVEERPLIEFNSVVLNYMTSKLKKQLGWPGVEVEEDIGFSTRA